MRPGIALRFVLPVVCAVLYAPAICAQLPERLERCLPYPTYAQEIKVLNAEVAAKMGIKELPQRIIVDDVKFDGPIHLSNSARETMVSKLKGIEFHGADWLQAVQDVGIAGAWQDQGYFKVQVIAKAKLISSDSMGEHFLVYAHVDEGSQYRLGNIQFRSSDLDDPLAFRPEELRQRIPLAEGDVFSAEKVRESLTALKRLYDSHGYVDFVVEPVIEFDEDHQRISLVMLVTQSKQFRVGTVEVFGLDPKLETLLRSKLKSGDVYNAIAIEDFFKENESALPPNVSPRDVESHRDFKNGTVNLRFDIFEICPQPQD